MVFAGKEAFQYLHEQEIPIEKWPYRDVTLNVHFFTPTAFYWSTGRASIFSRCIQIQRIQQKSKTYHSYYMRPELLDHLQQEGRNTPEESRFVGFNKIVVDEDYAAATTVQAGAVSGAQDHFCFRQNDCIAALSSYSSRGFGSGALEALMN